MKFLDLSTDVLALKCIKNYVFIGIGCTLYVINKIDYKIKSKTDALHPDNIHGIVTKSDNKIVVYGGKSLCIFHFEIIEDLIKIQKINNVQKFDDWIISIEWLGQLNNSNLTILFAHNYVSNYEFYKNQFSTTVCKETCLLYAGAISGEDYKAAIIFSGTVFQEILIWTLKTDSNIDHSEVLYRLKGHKGVIFSVFYSSQNNLICSTSDDRTVRLWKVFNQLPLDHKSTIWKNVEIFLQATMYGHTARVWRAVLFKDIIASIGEDSRICFWNLCGELIHKIEAHGGAPIWCIDISEDDTIYSGAADGSVNSWPLSSIKHYTKEKILLSEEKKIVPKYVMFTTENDILVHSALKDNSKIFQFKASEYKLIKVYNLFENDSTYCIIELSLNRQCFALASINGHVTLYKEISNKWEKMETYKITDSKIFSLKWLNIDTILVSAIEGNLYIIKFLENGIKILSHHILPSSRERWITSACIYNNLLVCGDRMGNIFIYKMENDLKGPIQSFKKIHGRLGVQSCIVINTNLVTTGRDGALRFYKCCDFKTENPLIEFLYTKNMPFDWVSRILNYNNDYWIMGFKEEDFIIYSILLKRILLKISCGGGHRSWDCKIHNKIINFVYIQKKQVHLVTIPIERLFISPLLVGFNLKETYCIKLLSTISNHNILISGGEDCTLHINCINNSTSNLELSLTTVNSFDGHLSSIKCISLLALESNKNLDKHLIFTGGGRAQLKIWEITVVHKEANFSKKDVFVKDLLSHMLHGPDKKRSKVWVGKELMYNADPETRYMDINTIVIPEKKNKVFIFIACSDGYLRTLRYNLILNEIQLVSTLPHRNRCILKIHSFVYQGKLLLMTMATDGLLNFWNVFSVNDSIDIQKLDIDKKENYNLHQSGINSFDIKILYDNIYLLATGGDDNLLSLLLFKVILNNNNIISIKTFSSWSTSSIHCAQITGVKILDNRIFSVGADQKLAIHKYFLNDFDILNVVFLKEETLCVSDIQGLTFCKSDKINKELLCIYGKGFQLLLNDVD